RISGRAGKIPEPRPARRGHCASASAPGCRRRPDAAARPARSARVDLSFAIADLSDFVTLVLIEDWPTGDFIPTPKITLRPGIFHRAGQFGSLKAILSSGG